MVRGPPLNTYDNWTVSIQRQLTQHLTLEADYNAVIAANTSTRT